MIILWPIKTIFLDITTTQHTFMEAKSVAARSSSMRELKGIIVLKGSLVLLSCIALVGLQ
jgi:hypothetical protein